MNRETFTAAMAVIATSCSSSSQATQQNTTTAQASPAPVDATVEPVPEDTPVKDPQAIRALEEMVAFLGQQKEFGVIGVTQTDEVLESGQKIQLTSKIEAQVRRPARYHAKIISDRKHREFYFDGATFTVNAPRTGYYATTQAPQTIAELFPFADERFGIELPLSDLFYWASNPSRIDAITSAIDLGPARVANVDTEHYAFRQPGIDWQVWIEKGSRPVPRKFVLTTTDEPSQPQHVIILNWDLNVHHADRNFKFAPKRTSKQIALDSRPTDRSAAR
jgi:hypothetical protein